VVYRYLETDDDYGDEDFADLLYWVREACQEFWPSFSPSDHWLGREDHVILTNSFAYVGVSEYCGLVSLWIVPRTDDYDGYSDPHASLCEAWIAQIADRFRETFAQLRHVATFSNGEAVFEEV
jgi:hypothetical protein